MSGERFELYRKLVYCTQPSFDIWLMPDDDVPSAR